jgi:glycerophosphoryl diester phosphodiesterase
MLVYGHRGASATHPENTLAAFRAAIEAGCDGIEFDVWNSGDGVPVVIHDRNLQRTTNGTGSVDTTPIKQLQELDAGDGEAIPMLAQVLELAPPSIHLDIEVKGRDAEEAILCELADRSRSSWAISSFDWTILRKLRGLDGDIDLWVLTERVTAKALAEAAELGATTLAVKHRNYRPTSAKRLAKTSLRVIAWTANDVNEVRRLGELDVHAICTDDPAGIIEALKERNQPG